MKKLVFVCAILVQGVLQAQTYQPSWESLDKRPVPQWFRDAKFGIFIHWGVYAVPGWSSKGNYSEWYQQGLQTNDTARIKYHKAKFGSRSYYDLANDFKAELFNPDDWAKLFEQSGAKYIVLTSKHHDGYALWPSKEASQTWGFKWNAKEIGPERDLLGDLFNAVRKTSVRAGMYYSLYEWFNPIWKSDPKKFVSDHTWPQMKDLVYSYQPDIFWTDGDWDAPAETWRSQEFLAWLYNESPIKDKVVVNDRWGTGVRFKHGGIFTPEYQPNLDFEDHYWEESRGMGFSYGYNREEDAWDYNSTQSLVLQLVDKVSRGGNFLLDIGPDEHGKIPPIMQERLLEIGQWLKINGEAIYGTSRWRTITQWSEGRKDYQPKKDDWKTGGDLVLKLTVDPDPGYAAKEVFYTYNANTNSLYAILPKYPSNRKIMLRDIVLPSGTNAQLLCTKQKLNFTTEGNNTTIELPEYDPNSMKAPYAYVIKIENYGNYMFKPTIKIEYGKGSLSPLVSITQSPGAAIYYTTDGSKPTDKSIRYQGPFSPGKTATIKAIAYQDHSITPRLPAIESAVSSEEAIQYEWMGHAGKLRVNSGIRYDYYESEGKIDLNSINTSAAKKTGVVPTISTKEKQRSGKFAMVFRGYIKIAKDGIYQFFTASDDESKLFIDDIEVVNNEGDHGMEDRFGSVALKKGFHKIKIQYYKGVGGNDLKVYMQSAAGKKEEIAADILFH